MSHFVTTSRLSWSGSFQKRLSIYRSRKISSCFNGTHQNYNVNNKRILKTKSKMRWVKKKLSEQLHRVTCQSLWKSISLQCQNVLNEWNEQKICFEMLLTVIFWYVDWLISSGCLVHGIRWEFKKKKEKYVDSKASTLFAH